MGPEVTKFLDVLVYGVIPPCVFIGAFVLYIDRMRNNALESRRRSQNPDSKNVFRDSSPKNRRPSSLQ